jgi:hypothetical protein
MVVRSVRRKVSMDGRGRLCFLRSFPSNQLYSAEGRPEHCHHGMHRLMVETIVPNVNLP